jgi:hypothetical protein
MSRIREMVDRGGVGIITMAADKKGRIGYGGTFVTKNKPAGAAKTFIPPAGQIGTHQDLMSWHSLLKFFPECYQLILQKTTQFYAFESDLLLHQLMLELYGLFSEICLRNGYIFHALLMIMITT